MEFPGVPEFASVAILPPLRWRSAITTAGSPPHPALTVTDAPPRVWATAKPPWLCARVVLFRNRGMREKVLNINSPEAVVVSTASSWSDRKPTHYREGLPRGQAGATPSAAPEHEEA